MTLSPIDRRLAASWHQRHIEIVAQADAIARALAQRIDRAQSKIIAAIATGKLDAETFHRIRRLYSAIIPDALAYLDPIMRRMIRQSDRDAKQRLARLVPRGWWRVLYPSMREQAEAITEAGPRGDAFTRLFGPGSVVGSAEPALHGQRHLSDEAYAKLVQQTILPPLPESDVDRIVHSPNPHTGQSYQDRLTDLSAKVKSPDALAGEIVTGIANGENIDQLRVRVDAQVGKLNGSAQRIARTEARRVAEKANRESWASLGDLLDGAQIIAVLDERTRPKHAARHGTIYRKGGTPPFEALPDLPDLPNCRCTAVPVLRTPESVKKDPAIAATFANEKGEHIPDPAAYEQWFRTADEPRQRLAVGSRRFDAVAKRKSSTGERPEWKDFIKPDGSLVPVQTLKRETAATIVDRKIAVGHMLAQREAQFRQIASAPFTIGPVTVDLLAATAAQRKIVFDVARKVVAGKLADPMLRSVAVRAAFPSATEEQLRAVLDVAIAEILRRESERGGRN